MNHINDMTLIGAVMFLVWAGIQAGIPRRFSPLVAIILSILLAFFYLEPGDPLSAFIHGIIIASSAVGFHSGTKNMLQQFNEYSLRNNRKK